MALVSTFDSTVALYVLDLPRAKMLTYSIDGQRTGRKVLGFTNQRGIGRHIYLAPGDDPDTWLELSQSSSMARQALPEIDAMAVDALVDDCWAGG